VQCAEALRVQAFFDNELDAISSADIERHLEHCAECRALLQDLEQVRVAMRRDLAYERAAPVLRARVLQALEDETVAAVTTSNVRKLLPKPKRSFLLGAFSGAGGMAIAAALALFLIVPTLTSPLMDGLVSAHVRSLMPDHLIDVASTDKHTVKPGARRCVACGRRLCGSGLYAGRRTCRLLRRATRGSDRVSTWRAHHQRVQLGGQRPAAAGRHTQWLPSGILP
jgi:anti-sigma factor RsiW